jgi:hypothetical protein
MARGLNNNNPLNIIKSGDVFQGEVKDSTDARFKQFTSPAYGYRAAFVTLGTYLTKYGRNTIEKIVYKWAPKEDGNDPEKYTGHVEEWSGVPRDRELTAASGDDCIQIVAAMSRMENGKPAVMADVEAGFRLQNKFTR